MREDGFSLFGVRLGTVLLSAPFGAKNACDSPLRLFTTDGREWERWGHATLRTRVCVCVRMRVHACACVVPRGKETKWAPGTGRHSTSERRGRSGHRLCPGLPLPVSRAEGEGGSRGRGGCCGDHRNVFEGDLAVRVGPWPLGAAPSPCAWCWEGVWVFWNLPPPWFQASLFSGGSACRASGCTARPPVRSFGVPFQGD